MRFVPLLLVSVGILTACGAASAPAASQPTAAGAAATAAPMMTAAPAPTGEPAATAAEAATPAAVPVPTAEPTAAPLPTVVSAVAPQPAPSAAPGTTATADAMVALAKADLAKLLNVSADTIQLQSIDEVEWNNSALGCARPDVAYMQVITPGYKIMLASGGKTYDYRSDMRRTVILCENTPKLK